MFLKRKENRNWSHQPGKIQKVPAFGAQLAAHQKNSTFWVLSGISLTVHSLNGSFMNELMDTGFADLQIPLFSRRCFQRAGLQHILQGSVRDIGVIAE